MGLSISGGTGLIARLAAGALAVVLAVVLLATMLGALASSIATHNAVNSTGANTPVSSAAQLIAAHLQCLAEPGPCSATNPDTSYDKGLPQAVLNFWQKSCPRGSNCFVDWQEGSLQCVMLITGAFALAGAALPATGNAIDFWSLYAHRSGWMEIPSSAPGTAAYQRSLPQPGDIMVWADNGPGHVAIVTAVVPPGTGQPGSITFAESNGPGALLSEPLLPDFTVQTWKGYTVYGYIRSLSMAGTNASARLARISQLAPAQYGPPSPSEFTTWAYSACSAASMTEVLNAYGGHYRIHDILAVEVKRGDITASSVNGGLQSEGGIADTVAQFNFQTTWGHSLSLDQIIADANAGTPVIVSFPPDRYAGGHLLVVRGGDANNVQVADSSAWNRTSISRAQFSSWWIGKGQALGFSAIVTPKNGQTQVPNSQYVSLAEQDAIAAGIDPQAFVRQINQESGFNPNARSPAGAEGIAQFEPQTAAGLGVDPWDPVAALKAAANLMASYVRTYGGDEAMALAAYNAGTATLQSALDRCGVAGWQTCLPTETQHYISMILGP
ncbi:MAG: transglycosylase SLT domain-containing protein [Streptosporangiaceae bacterium]